MKTIPHIALLSTMLYIPHFAMANENPLASLLNPDNLPLVHISEELLVTPYILSTDASGMIGGMFLLKKGLLQPQTTTIATLFYGSSTETTLNSQTRKEHAKGGAFALLDYALPTQTPLTLSLWGIKRFLPNATYYINNHSISSDEEAYTQGPGDADSYALTLKHSFHVETISGKHTLSLSLFYEHYTFENIEPDSPHTSNGLSEWNTQGVRLAYRYDTTNQETLPTQGYRIWCQYSRDFGNGNSLQSWDAIEGSFTYYQPLLPYTYMEDTTLVYHIQTAYSPSWEYNTPNRDYPAIDAHQPPPWEGAHLGGSFRLRGYDQDRFSAKASLFGAMEYRATLAYNPFASQTILPFSIEKFQVVPFVEAGSVASGYNHNLLNKFAVDGGLGFRATVAKVPVRLDVAYSQEGIHAWIMLFDPFRF